MNSRKAGILILIVGLCIFVYVVIYLLEKPIQDKNFQSRIDRFENPILTTTPTPTTPTPTTTPTIPTLTTTPQTPQTPQTPTTPTTTPPIPTPANKNTTCSNSTDMINVCMNYENCCTGSGTNLNSKCFCVHPFVGGCNDAYKSCIANAGAGGDTSSCDSTLKGCCSKYSSIDIFSSNFQKPINAMQTSNQLCTLNGLPDLEQRCMELCQTNPACKAYSLAIGGCTLYDNVNNNIGKQTDKYIYVMKI